MAFDGIVIANLAKELNHKLADGRFKKRATEEKNVIYVQLKNAKSNI